jgi:subtilisin-like proprotein convertase family protein
VDSLNVSSSTSISDIKMFIGLNHQKLSDLQIILFSPDGDSLIVWNSNIGLNGNVDYLTTVFDDESDNELLDYKYVDFGPNIKPANSLNSAFSGKNPKGIWKLKIVDLYNGNTGFLYGWGLRFNNVTGVEDNDSKTIPAIFSLEQNYPNPFNPSTTISYSLPKASNVKLTIYNLLGQEVTTLVNSFNQAGKHLINFNALNLASGVYIYSIKADGFVSSKKLILLK